VTGESDGHPASVPPLALYSAFHAAQESSGLPTLPIDAALGLPFTTKVAHFTGLIDYVFLEAGRCECWRWCCALAKRLGAWVSISVSSGSFTVAREVSIKVDEGVDV
jgi:hypothetical protein